VEQNEIELGLTKSLDRRFAAMDHFRLVTTDVEDIGKAFSMIDVVVDDQNAAHAATLSGTGTGRLTRIAVPRPTSLSTPIEPSCSVTICFTVARPRPVPKLLVLNSGSKMRPRFSGVIPGPLSETTSSIPSAPSRLLTVTHLSLPSVTSPSACT